MADFILGGSKITADGDCSHEIKRPLLLGKKVMTNLDSILKSRDITLSTKVRPVKARIFPMVMYGCESWTIKKADQRRTDAFQLLHWWRLLRVLWTARKSNQSILKEITLNTNWKDWWHSWSSNNFDAKSLLIRKTLGKTDGQRRRGAAEDEIVRQYHWLSGHESEQTLGDAERGTPQFSRCPICYWR